MFKIDPSKVRTRSKPGRKSKVNKESTVPIGVGTASLNQVYQYCEVCDTETVQYIGIKATATRCSECLSVLIRNNL